MLDTEDKFVSSNLQQIDFLVLSTELFSFLSRLSM